MLKPPAVRFIRIYDYLQSRMVNIWQELTTQEQIDSCPQAVELCVQAQTIEKALEEIKKVLANPYYARHGNTDELFAAIVEASKQPRIKAQDSIYVHV